MTNIIKKIFVLALIGITLGLTVGCGGGGGGSTPSPITGTNTETIFTVTNSRTSAITVAIGSYNLGQIQPGDSVQQTVTGSDFHFLMVNGSTYPAAEPLAFQISVLLSTLSLTITEASYTIAL